MRKIYQVSAGFSERARGVRRSNLRARSIIRDDHVDFQHATFGIRATHPSLHLYKQTAFVQLIATTVVLGFVLSLDEV